MIKKVLKLDNGLEYCVLEEIVYNNKQYILSFQVNNEEDVASDNYLICEIKKGLNGDYTLSDIEDMGVYENVSNILLTQLTA